MTFGLFYSFDCIVLQDHEQSIEESNTMIVNKIETERQLARQLLQRCGNETNIKSSSTLGKLIILPKSYV